MRLTFGGMKAEQRTLTDADINGFVSGVLLSEDREHPVALLSPTEEGECIIPPSVASDELLGLAHLYVIDQHPATFRLSDALGDRRLSCYWVRCACICRSSPAPTTLTSIRCSCVPGWWIR